MAREAISKIPLMKLVARMINIRPDDRLSTSDVLSGPGFNNFNPLRDICQQIKNRNFRIDNWTLDFEIHFSTRVENSNLVEEIKLLSKLNNIKLLDTSSFEQVGFPFEIFQQDSNSVLARNQRHGFPGPSPYRRRILLAWPAFYLSLVCSMKNWTLSTRKVIWNKSVTFHFLISTICKTRNWKLRPRKVFTIITIFKIRNFDLWKPKKLATLNSRMIHDQGKSFLCWAFAIASMLRNSLRLLLKQIQPRLIKLRKVCSQNKINVLKRFY